jgi:hypothetical protein
MKSHYSIEKRPGYLYMVITGEYDLSDFKEYFKIVMERCTKEKTFKLLVNNLNLKGTDIPMNHKFALGEEIGKVIGSKLKGAVVWPARDIDGFTETVAKNRGGNMQLFGDVESAERWLLEDS